MESSVSDELKDEIVMVQSMYEEEATGMTYPSAAIVGGIANDPT